MFGEYCGSCHGVHSSNSLAGPGFKASTAHISQNLQIQMPPFGNLSSVQIDELIAYLKTL
jgi:mono/diheme cytochrome c family protein